MSVIPDPENDEPMDDDTAEFEDADEADNEADDSSDVEKAQGDAAQEREEKGGYQ